MAKMSMLRKGILSLGMVSASLFGYEFNRTPEGIPEKWNREELRCYVNPALEQEYKDAFFECANRWSAALDGKIKFVENDGSRYDIYFDKETFDINKVGRSQWLRNADGILTFCTISLNSERTFSRSMDKIANTLNLDTVIMHEIGHALGLKDLYAKDVKNMADPWILCYDMPTMFDGYYRVRSKSFLHLDDIRGIRKLYGLLDPVVETIPFSISKIVGKRRKGINEFRRLSRGLYEFSSPIDDRAIVFSVDGNIYPENPAKCFFTRGMHLVIAEYRGRVGIQSLTIGRVPRAESNADVRGSGLPDMKF